MKSLKPEYLRIPAYNIYKAGSAGYIEVSSENGQACADAVRFVKK